MNFKEGIFEREKKNEDRDWMMKNDILTVNEERGQERRRENTEREYWWEKTERGLMREYWEKKVQENFFQLTSSFNNKNRERERERESSSPLSNFPKPLTYDSRNGILGRIPNYLLGEYNKAGRRGRRLYDINKFFFIYKLLYRKKKHLRSGRSLTPTRILFLILGSSHMRG